MKKGFSLTEVMFGTLLMALMAILVVTCLRATVRSNAQASAFSLARTLVASKISQLQAAGYGSLNGPALGQSGAQIVDGTPTSPTAKENTNGGASATFEFTKTNQLVQYFPPSTQTDAPRGWIYMAPYLPSKTSSVAGDLYTLVRITVQVQWRDTNGMLHSFSETSLIPSTTP